MFSRLSTMPPSLNRSLPHSCKNVPECYGCIVVCVCVFRDRKRIRGNELFQRKDYELAVNSYDK